MSKNVVIFSDGTGQRSGILFDENRSNIYKLYRATRCATDSAVDPREQVAFYDPGIGTDPSVSNALSRTWSRLRNLVATATGFGLTGNIIDCYAAIIRLWRPGDRIFLFGFSRGAYTVRCVGGVLAHCGVPTLDGDGSPVRRDPGSARRIAAEAVRRVYQHTSSRRPNQATPRQKELLDQRSVLAREFRRKYGSDDNNQPNVYPYFLGVFDTVASLANPAALVLLIASGTISLFAVGYLLSFWSLTLGWWIALLVGGFAGLVSLWYVATHIKLPRRINGHSWIRTLHFTEPRMKFYDTDLSPSVRYARHAISIDESRASFPRVPWGFPSVTRPRSAGEPDWFQQYWFAGNHSDVGGSYPDDEARLSDIALSWILEAAAAAGLKHDPTVLRLHPDPSAMQHDEVKSSIFKYFGTKARIPPQDAPLHSSVLARFAAAEVVQWDVSGPYRPVGLRDHNDVKHYYS